MHVSFVHNQFQIQMSRFPSATCRVVIGYEILPWYLGMQLFCHWLQCMVLTQIMTRIILYPQYQYMTTIWNFDTGGDGSSYHYRCYELIACIHLFTDLTLIHTPQKRIPLDILCKRKFPRLDSMSTLVQMLQLMRSKRSPVSHAGKKQIIASIDPPKRQTY